MKLFLLAALLAGASAQAAPCYPLTLPDANSPMCGAPEMRAVKLAIQKGLLKDIKNYVEKERKFFQSSFPNSEVVCTDGPITAEPVYESPGAHQSHLAVLIRTKAGCQIPGRKTVSSYNHFLTLVELDSLYPGDEKVKLLYKSIDSEETGKCQNGSSSADDLNDSAE